MKLVKFNNRPFDSLFSDLFNDELITMPSKSNVPSVNIKENEMGYSIEVAAPGYKKDDIHIEVDNGILTISSEIESKSTEENEKYNLKEFSFTSFKRSFTLPETVNEEKIKADYQDGMLTIQLPKVDAAIKQPKRKVKIG